MIHHRALLPDMLAASLSFFFFLKIAATSLRLSLLIIDVTFRCAFRARRLLIACSVTTPRPHCRRRRRWHIHTATRCHLTTTFFIDRRSYCLYSFTTHIAFAHAATRRLTWRRVNTYARCHTRCRHAHTMIERHQLFVAEKEYVAVYVRHR